MTLVLVEKQIIYYHLVVEVVVVVAASSASELEPVVILVASYTLVLALVLEQMRQIVVAVVEIAVLQPDLMQYTLGLMQYNPD
jgi:hypothetical protein